MKKVLVAVVILILSNLLLSQESGIIHPDVWLKLNNSERNRIELKNSYYGNEFLILDEQIAMDSLGQINYNNSLPVEEGFLFHIDSVNFQSKEITVMFAHQVSDSLTERLLWQLNSPTGEKLSLSTQKINYVNGSIVYNESNKTEAVVSSLSISWEEKPLEAGDIFICGNDSLAFDGLFSEFIFFDKPLDDTLQQIWVSYLAVKHGATLYQSSYLNSMGAMLWDYDTCKKYSHSIIAIGRDDVFELNQKQSKAFDNALGIGFGEHSESNRSNGAIIPDNNFVFIGCDTFKLGKKQEMLLENNFSMTKYGNSLISVYGDEISSIPGYIRVDASNWEGNPERYHLFIDRSGTGEFNTSELEFYQSSGIDSTGIICFDNIYWDIDGNGKDLICFGYLTTDSIINQELVYGNNPELIMGRLEELQESAELRNTEEDFMGNSGQNIYTIHPNPSKGIFSLEIKYDQVTEVEVRIFNLEGKIVRHMKDSGKSYYTFEENINISGQYLIEISSPLEKRSMKLIIN